MPPNGGIVRSENVQMKPFFPKGKFNSMLYVRVPGRAVKSNGFPGGHTDLHRRDPGLKENFLEIVTVVEMHSAPFRPEVVHDQAMEYVKRLPCVRVAAFVVHEEARHIVVKLRDDFAKQHEGPSDLEVALRLPFAPDAFEGLPSVLSLGTIEQAVLRGLLGAQAAHLTVGGGYP